MPRARFTLAEEVCHLILEYELWKDGQIPDGAEGHALSRDQHYYVERDAKSLASALLMPAEDFRVEFRSHWRDLEKVTRQETVLVKNRLLHLATAFDVSKQAAFYRARNVQLIDENGLPVKDE